MTTPTKKAGLPSLLPRSDRLLHCVIWRKSSASMRKHAKDYLGARPPLLRARRRHAVLPLLNSMRVGAKAEAAGTAETTTEISGTHLLRQGRLSSSTILVLRNRTRLMDRGRRSRAVSGGRRTPSLQSSRSVVLEAPIAVGEAGLEWATGAPEGARLRKAPQQNNPSAKNWRIATGCVDGDATSGRRSRIEFGMLDGITVACNKLG